MTSPLEKFRVGDTVTVDDPLIDNGVVTRVGRKYVTVTRLRARPLDRLVEAGASPQPGSVLEAHMMRLGTFGHRESLAAELRHRATALLCDQVMSLPPGRVNVPAVWEAADLIDRVEKRLLNHHGVSPRGTARLRRLLADWSGPLRRHGSGSLCAELRAVLTAL